MNGSGGMAIAVSENVSWGNEISLRSSLETRVRSRFFFLGFLYPIWPVDEYVIASIRFMICLSNSNELITKYSSKERREVKVAHQLHNESPNEANHTSSRVPYFRSPCEPSKRCFELWLRFRQFYLKITKTHLDSVNLYAETSCNWYFYWEE